MSHDAMSNSFFFCCLFTECISIADWKLIIMCPTFIIIQYLKRTVRISKAFLHVVSSCAVCICDWKLQLLTYCHWRECKLHRSTALAWWMPNLTNLETIFKSFCFDWSLRLARKRRKNVELNIKQGIKELK